MSLEGYSDTTSGSSWTITFSGDVFKPTYTGPDPNVSVAEQEELQSVIEALIRIGELHKAKIAISKRILSNRSDEDLLLIAETAAEILEMRHSETETP